MAIKALQAKQVQRIILTRPAVEAGERLGFLPGDLMAKIDPYLRPLYDALYDMVEPEGAQRLLERQTVEVAPLAFMRGRTLNNSFIILDEAQNTTPEQMKMFLTRIGFGSRVVVTGDVTQIDVPNGKSGLVGLERVLAGIEGLAFVKLGAADVVRHRIVADIVAAYERDGERAPAADGRASESDRHRATFIDVVTSDEQGAADAVAVDTARWSALATAVLAAEGAAGELTLTFVDRDEIAALNAEHLGETGPTDVLSFPLDTAGDAPSPGVPVLLGDVVVCPAVAADQAPAHAGTLDDELALLVVHGVLHVLGHDHAEPAGPPGCVHGRSSCSSPTTGTVRSRPRSARSTRDDRARRGARVTTTDVLILAAIVVLVILLIVLAIAETGLNRISKVRAYTIDEMTPSRASKALVRLVEHPERFINPLLVTVTVAADRPGDAHHRAVREPARRRVGRGGRGGGQHRS